MTPRTRCFDVGKGINSKGELRLDGWLELLCMYVYR